MRQILGKKAVRHDPRTFRMAKYLLPSVVVPNEVSWVMEIAKWPMFMNDVIGDCVLAAQGHMVQQWSAYANPPGFVPSDADVLRAYEAVGRYNPSDPTTDNGADMLSALNHWRKVGMGGHKITAFVKLNARSRAEVMVANWLFGNVYAGFQLPASAQGARSWVVPDGGTTSEEGAVGSWGGHCVPIMAASPKTLTCVTWGQRLKMSWNFFHDYCDEAYAILSPDWFEKSGVSRNHFDFSSLQKDLITL